MRDHLPVNGASACTLPDTVGLTYKGRRCPATDTPLYAGESAVRYGNRYFESFRALAVWMLDNRLVQRATLPNHRCCVCDSDGCRVMYHGRYFCDIGCFAEWLEENGEAEWDVVPDDREGRVRW